MYPQPGSIITPGGTGTGPDDDPNNPVNRLQEPASPTEEVSQDDIDEGVKKLELHANDPNNATKNKSANEAEAQAGGESGRGGNDSASLPGENFYNPKESKSRKVTLSRKQKMAFGTAGFIGGGLLFAAIPLLAPLKLMQFGNMLRQAHFFNLEDMGDNRTSKLVMLSRYNNTGSIQGTRLSRLGAKSAAKWEARLLDKSGVKMVYSQGTGRFVGFEIVDPEKASGFVKELEKYDVPDHEGGRRAYNTGIDGRPMDPNSRFLRADRIRDPTGLKRKGMIRTAVKSVELGKISSGLGSRKLKTLSGVGFHPIDDALRKIVDVGVNRWSERKKAATQNKADKIRSGDFDVRVITDGPDEFADPDNPDQDTNNRRRAVVDDASGLLDGVDSPDTDLDAMKKRIYGRVGQGAGAAAAVAIMCGVRDLGNQVAATNYENVLIMQRMAMENIALASQIPTLQGLSIGAIRYYWDLMTDDEGREAIAAVSKMQEGGSYKDGEDYANARYNSENSKPFLFEILDSIPLLKEACAIGDGIGGFIRGIPLVGNIVEVAEKAAAGAIDVALEGVTGYTMEGLIGLVVDFLANDGVNAVAEGALRGVLGMYGSLYASNDDCHASGCRKLTNDEVGALNDYRQQVIAQERQEKSLFARVFDVTATDSVVAQAVQTAPSTHNSAAQKMIALLNPLNPVTEYVGGFGATPAVAQDEFDYGVDKYGFSLSELNSTIAEDPYLNADIVENTLGLENLVNEYGECFPTKLVIEEDGVGIDVESFTEDRVNQFTADEKCSDPNNEALLRFRFYLYDTVAMTSLNCYEGDGSACSDIGATSEPVNLSAGGGGTTGQTIADFQGPFIDCSGDPREQIFINESNNVLNWSTVTPTGIIGQDSGGLDIPVYVRDACAGQTEIRTVVIASGIHGLENGGQRVAWELLFNTQLPPDVRVVAIPEVSPWAVANSSRTNANGVNLNRNFDYQWGTKDRDDPNPGSGNYRGPSAASEPETQAIQNFLSTLGKTSFLASYHSNLNYVASSGPNQKANENIEQRYYELALPYNITSREGANWDTSDESGTGFLEGWYNFQTGSPSFLLELTDSIKTTKEYVKGHADTIKTLLEEGVIQ